MRNFKFLGAMLVFLVSLESCKGCAVGAGAGAGAGTDAGCPAGQIRVGTSCQVCPAGQEQINGACVATCPAGQVKVNGACAAPFTGTCPTGQINIDDGKTSVATSCKAVVAVADKNELVSEIKKAIGFGTGTTADPATNWTANLNYIDTSKVTDMSYLFADKTQTAGLGGNDLEKFNGRIDKWNTSSVTNMESTFQNATAFNQDIGNWKTDNVTNMQSTFQNATAFNQDIGNWKTDNVRNMYWMFQAATKFNQDIGNWNVSKVTDMQVMFGAATAFDKDLSRWNPTAVSSANMDNMFAQTAMETNNNFGKHAPWYCTTTGTKGTGGCPP